MNLSEAYRLYSEDSEAGARARQLLDQQDWLTSIAEFDPRTGDALPLGLDTVLHRLANRDETTNLRDRLWRLAEHSRASVERLFASLSEDPRREQAILPIRAVKELNATSFIALSRRPGRNVREKLAGKPYMQAVRRYQSVDLPQNRLLKEFATQLADLLEMRQTSLGHEDPLIGDIHRWLRSEEALAISRWDNLPPNNTLLSHRDYRRVWDSWTWLQAIDDDMDRDFDHVAARGATVEKWEDLGKAYSEGKTAFGNMPVLFDYDTFTIEPWREPLVRSGAMVSRPDSSRQPVAAAVCVDLSYLRPRYASSGDVVSRNLAEAFLWQHWENEEAAVDLELFDSDAVVLHRDATTLTSADLFLSRGTGDQVLQSAAHAFARKLSAVFASPDLVWLIPDALNDFELQVARRIINARFAHAEPLPRSVAAVFEHVDHSRIPRTGYQAVIVDSFGGTTYATKLITGYDSELEMRVPATRGFYWERTPHVQINDIVGPSGPSNEIPVFNGDDEWFDAVPAQELSPIDARTLRAHPQIGDFDICVTLAGSPVVGGVRLHDLQFQAGDLPLWRDHIPELSIKAFNEKVGRLQPFVLVDRETTIRPVRGVAIPIPVGEEFKLPAGRPFYEFPLFQGQDPDDLGYVARLESPAFPLPADVKGQLRLTYTYGADDPYHLVFEPLDGSFKPVQAKWQPKIEVEVTDAPAPEYPEPQTWQEIQQHYNAETGKTTDYPTWAVQKTEELLNNLTSVGDVVHGRLKSDWKTNPNGWHFAFAERDDGSDIYIHENALAGRVPYSTITKGDDIYFTVTERNGRKATRWVAKSPAALTEAASKDTADSIRRALYVPYIRTWSDGRSLSDPECPARFRMRMSELLPKVETALHSASTSQQVQNELRFLFSCTHRDMPMSVSAELVAGLQSGPVDEKSVGFSLGDLSQAWQRDAFNSLMARSNAQTLRVFARAIWRNKAFVRAFDSHALAKIADRTLRAIKDADRKVTPTKYEVASLTRYCELLLGLLRTRESDDEDIRMLLQPHQQITKELAEQIERVIDASSTGRLRVESRVQVANLPEKPVGDETPDLLFALRLYLTGDVGAYAIRVTGVNDGEDD